MLKVEEESINAMRLMYTMKPVKVHMLGTQRKQRQRKWENIFKRMKGKEMPSGNTTISTVIFQK